MQCDPERVAALVRAGDLAALDSLTRCHGERLLAVARRWCRSDAEAEDAVQDALLAAGTHLGDWRGEGSVEGWVVRVVTRACTRMRRGRKNDPALHATDLDVADGTPDAAWLAERADLTRALGEALAQLSPEDRAMLVLAEAEGWTGPEIAARTGLTPEAVRARLSRARKRARAHLEARRGADPELQDFSTGPVTFGRFDGSLD
jgi:RNA polymerase sigma-70 factor (ECF subfamily)